MTVELSILCIALAFFLGMAAGAALFAWPVKEDDA